MGKEHKRQERDSMTQLIGAICENRKKVILLSDRMVTTANGTLAFEHETKSTIISLNAMVLTAGTIHEPEFIDNAREEIKERPKIFEIADTLSKHYRKIRKQRIIQEVLEPIGFSSFKEFHERQTVLHENMILEISENIKRYPFDVTLLLAGVDEQAHLYMIDEPGRYISFDELGFCCPGSGLRHADPVFAFYGYSPKLKTAEALKIAFEAKKRAEMAGAVGKQTDIWIIDKDAISEVTPDTIKELEESHAAQDDYSRLIASVEVKTKKVGITKA